MKVTTRQGFDMDEENRDTPLVENGHEFSKPAESPSGWGSGRLRQRLTPRLTEKLMHKSGIEISTEEKTPANAKEPEEKSPAKAIEHEKEEDVSPEKLRWNLRKRKSSKPSNNDDEDFKAEEAADSESSEEEKVIQTKRPRGRPKKILMDEKTTQSGPESADGAVEEGINQKELELPPGVNFDHIERLDGKPSQNDDEDFKAEEVTDSESSVEEIVIRTKRPRGRPKKILMDEQTTQSGPESADGAVEEGVNQKELELPPGVNFDHIEKLVGKPSKNDDEDFKAEEEADSESSEEEIVIRTKRSRGRPKKILMDERTTQSGPESADGTVEEEVNQKELELPPGVNFDHIEKLDEMEEFRCKICNRKFRNESSKILHIACKINEKSFNCEYCRQKELTRSEYESHLQKHTGKEHFVCHYCGEWFLKSKNLVFHVLVHEGKSHFFCKPCKKRFPFYRKKAHVLIHTGERQFTCQKCKKNFVVNVNQDEVGDEDKQPAGICICCGEKFRTMFQFYTHVLTESRCHYSCEQCGLQFSSKKWPFKCRECKAQFARREILESHKKCLHPKSIKPKKERKVSKKRKTSETEKETEAATEESQDSTCENPIALNSELADNDNDSIFEEEASPESEQIEEDPIEPLTQVEIQANDETVFIFEPISDTQDQWQQTNLNDTNFTMDNDFCSQCQISFTEELTPAVNTMCGHLICETCFGQNIEGCLLCIPPRNRFELTNLNNEEKQSLELSIEVLEKLAKKRFKTDETDECTDSNEAVANGEGDEGIKYPQLKYYSRGPVVKSHVEKCLQYPEQPSVYEHTYRCTGFLL